MINNNSWLCIFFHFSLKMRFEERAILKENRIKFETVQLSFGCKVLIFVYMRPILIKTILLWT